MVASLIRQAFELFRGDERGGVLMIFGVALPALLIGAGVAIDSGILSEHRTAFQNAADASALAAAREFRLANASSTTVQSVAEKFAATSLKASNHPGTAAASVDLNRAGFPGGRFV